MSKGFVGSSYSSLVRAAHAPWQKNHPCKAAAVCSLRRWPPSSNQLCWLLGALIKLLLAPLIELKKRINSNWTLDC